MHKVLADSFSSIDDVNRAVKKVSERISELLDLQKKTEKQLATVSASFTFEIDVGDKKSPSIHMQPETFKVTNLKKMRSFYASCILAEQGITVEKQDEKEVNELSVRSRIDTRHLMGDVEFQAMIWDDDAIFDIQWTTNSAVFCLVER